MRVRALDEAQIAWVELDVETVWKRTALLRTKLRRGRDGVSRSLPYSRVEHRSPLR